MKKKYKKPTILMESFEVSQNIAGCGSDLQDGGLGYPTHANRNSCGWSYGDYGVIFVQGNTNCTGEQLPSGVEVDGFCYNAPTANVLIFAS